MRNESDTSGNGIAAEPDGNLRSAARSRKENLGVRQIFQIGPALALDAHALAGTSRRHGVNHGRGLGRDMRFRALAPWQASNRAGRPRRCRPSRTARRAWQGRDGPCRGSARGRHGTGSSHIGAANRCGHRHRRQRRDRAGRDTSLRPALDEASASVVPDPSGGKDHILDETVHDSLNAFACLAVGQHYRAAAADLVRLLAPSDRRWRRQTEQGRSC